MIIILEISESKGAEFSGYEFYFKKNMHRIFLYLSECPFNNSEMKAKVRIVYMKKITCNDCLDSWLKEGI